MISPSPARWFSYRPFWLLLLLLVVLRLPSFDRPLSKHHDFNNAVILINAVSWQQAGGGSRFSFTPLMNFQGDANKIMAKGHHVDRAGNHVYLSFGPGWYIVPYAVFYLLETNPTAAGLEWLSIIIGLISTTCLFALLVRITRQRRSAFMLTGLFTLLPAPLWYMGHSYVTTGIMLPLAIWLLALWHRMAQMPRPTAAILLQVATAGILLIYIEWFGVFLLAGMAAWALWRCRSHRSYTWLTLTAGITALAGILLVLGQFAAYLGWEQVWGYWQSRFTQRSVESPQGGYSYLLGVFAASMAGGYAPLLLLTAGRLIRQRRACAPNQGWLLWALAATAVYNLTFLTWSLEHEFAAMAPALLLTLWLAATQSAWLDTAAGRRWAPALMIGSITIFFYVNRPGPKSRNGEQYNQWQALGQSVRANVPAEAYIFTSLPNAKIEEWYARRTFQQAKDRQEAAHMADSLQLQHAVWLEIRDGKLAGTYDLRHSATR